MTQGEEWRCGGSVELEWLREEEEGVGGGVAQVMKPWQGPPGAPRPLLTHPGSCTESTGPGDQR